MILTFCGHTYFSQTEEYERKFLSILEEKVGDAAADFYLGGYGAFDTFAFECCKQYKQTHPNVHLVLITPYLTPEFQKNHLQFYKRIYDSILFPDVLTKVPPRFAILRRNKWMVEQADVVVACIEHTYGGAYQTYRHAQIKKKEIFNLSERAQLL